jgi:hypothetical protein
MARLAKRKEAAAHIGLSVSSFDDWIEKGFLPGPIEGTRKWDLVALDLAIDRLSNLDRVKPRLRPEMENIR